MDSRRLALHRAVRRPHRWPQARALHPSGRAEALLALFEGTPSAGLLAEERIREVETGACLHTAIRDDLTMNLLAVEDMEKEFAPVDHVLDDDDDEIVTHSHA